MKVFLFMIPIIGIILLSLLWIVIQLDVKFSFGTEQSEYIFKKGLELSYKINCFIAVLIGLNVLSIIVGLFVIKKKSI